MTAGAASTATVPAEVVARMAGTEVLLVACDYDGTLAPIVTDPGQAWPAVGAVDVMARLAALPGTVAAVVTGRSLTALEALAPFPATVRRVGGHGAERDTAGPTAPGPAERALLAQVARECARLAAGVPGALLEHKPFSVAVHVRRCSRPEGEALLAAVAAGPGSWPGVHRLPGKRVLELAVVRADKGLALERLRRETGATGTVFIGDDVTDEAAFGRLAAADVGVKVGPGETRAPFRLDHVGAVVALLERLAAARSGASRQAPDR